MKKILLILAAAGFSTAQAQVRKVAPVSKPVTPVQNSFLLQTMHKGTAAGDTIIGINFPPTQLDSLTAYYYDEASPFDTGYIFGMNAFGDQAFAERFDISGNDSSVRVIGTFAMFDGILNATTNKTINLHVWSQGPMTQLSGSRPNVLFTGMPNTVLATQNVRVDSLGIDTNGNALKFHAFSTPTASISDSFFVGYAPDWTHVQANGEFISLMTTRDGYRYQPVTTISGTDTIINVLNAVQWSDGTWNDEATQNAQTEVHLALFPVFIVGAPQSVTGITHKELTFFGNYPNPANDFTNIRFSLAKSADVTITLTDMTGRILRTQELKMQPSGESTVKFNTSDLAAGNYLYLVRTSAGDGMAAQMTVVR